MIMLLGRIGILATYFLATITGLATCACQWTTSSPSCCLTEIANQQNHACSDWLLTTRYRLNNKTLQCCALIYAQLMCYSCPKTYNPEECQYKLPCSANEACSVQQITVPHNEVYFWSGCEDIEICGAMSDSSSGPIIGKRQESVLSNRCIYCCSTDLCNRNCTSFVNLALFKPAYQSSVAYNGKPELAVDGDSSKDYFTGNSCMHTRNEPYAWWAVDLGNIYHITTIKMHERGDAGADGRTFHLKFLVSTTNATQLDRNSNDFTVCGAYYGHSSDGATVVIDCPKNTVGRWVRVQEDNPTYEHMHFCELEVFGF